jgi:hypothetical protein
VECSYAAGKVIIGLKSEFQVNPLRKQEEIQATTQPEFNARRRISEDMWFKAASDQIARAYNM